MEFSIEDLLRLSDDEDLAEDDSLGEYIVEFGDDKAPAGDAPAGQREHFSLLPIDFNPLADPIPAGLNADHCRGRDSTATVRGNSATDRRPAAKASTDMTPRVIAAGLNRRGPGARPLPNDHYRAPECILKWLGCAAWPNPNRTERPRFRSILDCATVFGGWENPSGKSRLRVLTAPSGAAGVKKKGAAL